MCIGFDFNPFQLGLGVILSPSLNLSENKKHKNCFIIWIIRKLHAKLELPGWIGSTLKVDGAGGFYQRQIL